MALHAVAKHYCCDNEIGLSNDLSTGKPLKKPEKIATKVPMAKNELHIFYLLSCLGRKNSLSVKVSMFRLTRWL
jgi:hypothetical protein